MAEKVNYTRSDIDRYLNKKMTTAEMYAFEKAMLTDPFLADAFEGFSNADPETSLKHLTKIEAEIRAEKEEARLVTMTKVNNGWWKIAAMVVVLTGIAFVGYRLSNTSSITKQVALNSSPANLPAADSLKADVTAESGNITPPPATYSAVAKNKVQPPFIKPLITDENALASTSAVKADSLNVASAVTMLTLDKNEPVAMAKAAPPAAMDSVLMGRAAGITSNNQRMASAKRQVVIHGKVTDAAGEAIEFATIKADDKLTQALTDARGEFSINTKDSNVNVSVSATGYLGSKAKVKAGASNNLPLMSSEPSLSEVVVTAYGVRKKTRKNKTEDADEKQDVMPVKGWKNFRSYERQQVEQYIDDAEEFNSGDVELEFTVAANGSPANIKVLNQPDKQNSDHAIKLLQQGPKWTSKIPGAQGVITIHY